MARQEARHKRKDEREYLESMFGALDPPPGTAWVWELFRELDCSRQRTDAGPQPIPYTEILAWSLLTGVGLESWEISALRRLDLEWLSYAAKEREKSMPKTPKGK